jgi:hypothetical protein
MVNTNRLRKIKQFGESDTQIEGQRTGSTAENGGRLGVGGHFVFRDGYRPCEPESFSRPCALPMNEIVPVHIVQIEKVHVIILRCQDGWVEVNVSTQSGMELIIFQPIHWHGSRLYSVGKFENLKKKAGKYLDLKFCLPERVGGLDEQGFRWCHQDDWFLHPELSTFPACASRPKAGGLYRCRGRHSGRSRWL